MARKSKKTPKKWSKKDADRLEKRVDDIITGRDIIENKADYWHCDLCHFHKVGRSDMPVGWLGMSMDWAREDTRATFSEALEKLVGKHIIMCPKCVQALGEFLASRGKSNVD